MQTDYQRHTNQYSELLDGTILILSVAVAAVAGRLVGLGYLVFAIMLPLLVMPQPSRLRASVIAVSYYLAAGADILQVGSYLKATETAIPPAVFLAAAASLQSVAWAVCWSRRPRPLYTSAALLVSALPPLGVLGWAHPFHAAGILFPTLGIVGLLLMLVLLELATFERLTGMALPFVALTASLIPAATRPVPPSWAGVQTRYGDVFTYDDPLSMMEAVEREARLNPASVLVWPESTVGHWNQATELFWAHVIHDARVRGKTLIFGSTVAIPDPSRTRYRNVVLFKGREEPSPVDQRTPVPVAMWQPASGGGVPLNPLSSPIREIAGQRAVFLICYEQLLAWSYFTLLFDPPNLLVGVANVYWVEGSSIPAVQTACLRSWARLFDIPFIQAVNQ